MKNGIHESALKTETHESLVNNEAGFSLIEVMIVAGISIVVGLGFATMMTNVGRQQQAVEVKSNINQLSVGVRGLASTPTSIQNSLTATN